MFTVELISRSLEQIRFSCGTCGLWRRIRTRYCGDRGRLQKGVGTSTLFPPPPMLDLTIGVEGRKQRFISRDKKDCKEECNSGGQVLIVFYANPPERSREGRFMGEDCDGKCRDHFPCYLKLVQKCKLVCGLTRSVIRCLLGSGVLPPHAHCTLSFRYVYRGVNIQNS